MSPLAAEWMSDEGYRLNSGSIHSRHLVTRHATEQEHDA